MPADLMFFGLFVWFVLGLMCTCGCDVRFVVFGLILVLWVYTVCNMFGLRCVLARMILCVCGMFACAFVVLIG